MTSGSKIAVVGASSMVGSRFCELVNKDLLLIEADLKGENPIDITDEKSVNDFYQSHQFETLILFSAYTDVDGAEEQRGQKEGACWKINVQGVENIVEAAKKFRKKIIFISTDFVFDGTSGPYSEDDPAGPNLDKMTWYGITKLEGEKIVNFLSKKIILRISFPYRAEFKPKQDFARKLLSSYEQGISLYANQQLTPTFIDDVAPAIELLISKHADGIYHLASPKTTTPYDFARYLIETFAGDTSKIKKGALSEDNEGKRPLKAGMKTEKIEKLGFRPTNWKEGIKKMAAQLSN